MKPSILLGSALRAGALLLGLLGAPVAHGQIVINEILAANDTTAPDNADFDDYSDWIELRNTSAQAQSLAGYFLTDDPTLPVRWPFPSGASIPANGYLLIRADGFDAGPGESHLRDASPWDRFTTLRYHTNFKLGSGGESVSLYRSPGGSQITPLVNLGAGWTYFDTGTDPGPTWTQISYNDAPWKSGNAQLGYGENDEATTLSFGNDSNAKHPAYYFRHSFSVSDPASLTSLSLRLLADDGAIVFLNGTEVARVRMEAGPATFSDYAANNAPEDVFDDFTLTTEQLRPGENLLAVEVHQVSGNSSDVSFDLSLTGERLLEPPVLVDSVAFGVQRPDISIGRDLGNPDNFVPFGEPTPGAANTTFPTLDPTPTSHTTFSLPGGFYQGNQQVALSTSSPGATIRYTLDGSRPSSSSPAFAAPIQITATTVVRARSFEPGKTPGQLATATYFIDEPTRPLPVVSFVVEPDNFFDETLGIYRNVYKGREAPVSLEYFDASRTLGFQVNAGARIGGENIWRFAQKPLNIAMRGKYGDDLISYKIFPDEDTALFDAIGFRNGGDNWPNAMLRDPMAPSLVRGQMDNDVAAYRPCVLYMNGQYWGIHNIRERHGDQYFFNKYHINAGNYDLLTKEHTINGTELVVGEGTTDAYLDFESHAENTDLSVQANYEAFVAQVDVDSLIDYVSMVDFVYESSWHHNQEFWRERKAGAKWRWTINDIDRGFNQSNVNSSLIDDMVDRHPIFKAMAQNTGFKNRFLQRYAAHISSTFSPGRITEITDRLAAEVDPEIARHIARWSSEGGIQSIASRQAELDEIKNFASNRLGEVYSDTARILGVAENTSVLTVSLSNPNAGRVLINGVPQLPGFTNQARLFRNIPFDLTAEPAPGYAFVSWSTGETTGALTRSLASDEAITANFQVSPETLIPATIASDTTLSAAASPYTTTGDITVPAGTRLTVGPGVSIRMPSGKSIYVKGSLQIDGTAEAPVDISARTPDSTWGAIAFVEASGDSTLSYFTIRDATSASVDPVQLKAAVSNFRSTIIIDHADIDAPLPIFARGGSTTLRHSIIHPQFTGDGINIKGGSGLVEDSTFVGNEAPDTDGIDFDSVTGGIIRRNRIYGFRASNSDAIDIGEGCVNLLISENRIYNSSDKGVSVGQGSTVEIEKNLIVGCALGVGIKDRGSFATIDQNTFAGNGTGVAVYEKNLDAGGGGAVVTNSIFSRSKEAPVSVDTASTLAVSYSISDTLAIVGAENSVADPLFTDADAYDFSLRPDSPAIDAGDAMHVTDLDGSRADIGAPYVYDPADFPFIVPNVVVINEIMAHSQNDTPDWIELYNTSNATTDISGWFLSDSKSDLRKYEIPEGTVLGPKGFLVFYEDSTFGTAAASTPFALSENGETAYLFAPGDGLYLDYLEEESFGPSPTGVSKGRHLKSSNTYNFISMITPTPGSSNSSPLVGPVVISEIMYHPSSDGDAEYLELTNITAAPVPLYDDLKAEGWRFTNGIEFIFPPNTTLAANERIIVTRNEIAFRANFSPPVGTRVFQWSAGGLSNSGEQIEFSSPGDLDAEGIRQFYRIDRINFTDGSPWPSEADGDGPALTRINEAAYGNDVINWKAASPSPGSAPATGEFARWAASYGLPADKEGFNEDADGDGNANGIEFVFGTDPTTRNILPAPELAITPEETSIAYTISVSFADAEVHIQASPDLAPGTWTDLPVTTTPLGNGSTKIEASINGELPRLFFRLIAFPNN